MGEILVGIFAVLVGALFCFSGMNVMRVLFPIMGFFLGFSAGAGMMSAISGDRFLGTMLGWILGFFVGLLFGVLAYFFYAFAVILAFAGVGFAITSGILTFLHLDWNWLVVILGTVVGIVFGLVALATNLPTLVLILATSLLGSAVILYGLMLVFNTASLGDFSSGVVMDRIKDHPGLYVLWIMLAFSGSITQVRVLGEQTKQLQEYWESSATFEEFVGMSSQPVKKKK